MALKQKNRVRRRRALFVCTLIATTTTTTTTTTILDIIISAHAVAASTVNPKQQSQLHLHRTISARRREFWMDWARGGATNTVQPVPVVAMTSSRRRDFGQEQQQSQSVVQHIVSTRTKQLTHQIKSKLLPTPPPKDETAFFYGVTVKMVEVSTSSSTERQHLARPKKEPKPKPPNLQESMILTLDEIRRMRMEMEELRRELQSLKAELILPPPSTSISTTTGESTQTKTKKSGVAMPSSTQGPPAAKLSKEEMEKFYKEISQNLDAWAKQLLQQDASGGDNDDWVQIKCNKAMRKQFNPSESTRVFVKWMKDARGYGHVDPTDDREYPCLKCTGIIHAPLDVVTLYLAKKENLPEYNDLIDQYKDLQEISPSAKVTLSKTPQILFIQPRNLVTYCEHKWLDQGKQLLVLNQAVRHPKRLNQKNVGLFDKSDWLDDKKQPMAFALRGANLLTPDPDDPQHKTRLTILAHGNPGKDVPTWAMKTVVGALANLEPYRFFFKINQAIVLKLPELNRELGQWRQQQQQQLQMQSQSQQQEESSNQLVIPSPLSSSSSSSPLPPPPNGGEEKSHGRTQRPAGIAQLGYACFWPNGGGTVEPTFLGPRPPSRMQPPPPPPPIMGRIETDDDDKDSDSDNRHHHDEQPQLYESEPPPTTTTSETTAAGIQLSAFGSSL